MSSFTLDYWRSKNGIYERVYINGDFIDDLKIYIIPGPDVLDVPRVFGADDKRFFPEPYASSLTPVEDVARQALTDHGLDFDDFTWEELLEAI